MLDISSLANRWGAFWGDVNATNTYRGTTVYTRADQINALFPTAAEQAIVLNGWYAANQNVDADLQNFVNDIFERSQVTLQQMCVDDSELPLANTDLAYLQKLVADMLTDNQTFQEPTVTINASAFTYDTADPITTLTGAPHGNGVVVGTIVNPGTLKPRYYTYTENVQFVCTTDSFSGGTDSGTETFSVQSFVSVDYSAYNWPKGSGVATSINATLGSTSTLIANAYFDDWGDPVSNSPADWTQANLSPGVSLLRSSDAYVGDYAVQFTGAGLGAELYQDITGLSGRTNYCVGLRVKRPGVVSQGVITLSFRDTAGDPVEDFNGDPLEVTIPLIGAAGDYELTYAVFSVPRSFPDTVRYSIKFTTAMAGGESILVATAEIRTMVPLYTSGPDVALLPGNVPWAQGDTYQFAFANDAGVGTFIRNLDRVYQASQYPTLDIPVSLYPTISNSLIA